MQTKFARDPQHIPGRSYSVLHLLVYKLILKYLTGELFTRLKLRENQF